MLYPVILCGGSGSRLWPLSRAARPKQFLDLTKTGKSLLQATVERLVGIPDIAPPLFICNLDHRFLVAEQLQSIGVKPLGILLEPVAKNTAPAVALAALTIRDRDPEATLLVLPADHCIGDVASFQVAVGSARLIAEQDYLVTFGVVPTSAETGYGYIERGDPIVAKQGARSERLEGYAIRQFVEKPDAETAQKYLDSGDFTWNSGMFLFRSDQYLDELARYQPEIDRCCKQALAAAYRDLDFTRVDEEAFKLCPSDSIDYAVMERTTQGAVLPLGADWSDVGSWVGLRDISEVDGAGNVILGDVIMHNTQNSTIVSESRLVATVGLNNTVVVETADAILVADQDHVQDVKSLVSLLQSSNRSEGSSHKLVYRPWGSYESICESDRFQVKKIVVNPGQKLSLQLHHHRAEHWIIVKGTAKVTCEDKVFTLKEDQSTYIPLGHKHRLENPGKISLELIEVQSGSYLGEDDIVRFDDDYGRGEGAEGKS